MKAVVFGATGLVGSAVLNACIANAKITKIYVVARRPLGDERGKNPKVETILHSDMAQYPPELLEKLKGIEICFWAIGGMISKFNNDAKLARTVNVDYCSAAATAIAKHLLKESPTGRIRFVLGSGRFTELDPNKSLWFLGETRRMKGDVENFVHNLAKQHPGKFEAFAVRPGLVIPDNPSLSTRLTAIVSPGITARQLAKVMVKIGIEGWKHSILEQEELLTIN